MNCTAFNGSTCSVSGSSCMFLLPDSKKCADLYGEGPDASTDICEDCYNFYVDNGKRCCRLEPLALIDGDIVSSKYIEDDVTSCGAFKPKSQSI